MTLKAALRRGAQILNSEGWIIETDLGLGEEYCKSLGNDDAPIRKEGYKGGNLNCTGGYFPGHANVHILFDANMFEYDDARAILEDWVRKNTGDA